MTKKISMLAALAMLACQTFTANADDWTRFRGPSGNGVATDSASIPTAWSPSANIAWKTELPGPGASSPIIVGGKAFVTCYSGYGLKQEDPGEIENLVRHLVCIDLETGKKAWQKDVKVSLPEDPYTGIGVTAHGYASHTPVSDGENIYAFFGKSGVHAYSMDGKELWNAEVGKESDPTKWGSSSSPIVYKNIVIVTASAESQSVIGFDKESGKELWRQEAEGLDGMWGTPTLVKVDMERTDLVMCVAKEMWGMDPENGKLRWHANATEAQGAYSSVVLDGKRVYAVTGRGGGSIAIDAGGSGDVSESNTAWTGRETSGFASPIFHKGRLYVVNRGILSSIDAESGKRIDQLRLKGAKQSGSRSGSLDYPSPVIAGDKMFYMKGNGQMFVFSLGDKLEQVSINQVTSEQEIFWGSPAISDGKMVIRSAKYLYCVTDKGDEVDPEDTKIVEAETPPAGGARGGGGGGRGGRFDPAAMFDSLDADKDGKVTETELEGNRMAERLMTLDKDSDKAVSKEEFTSGISSLFRRGGGGGGGGRPERPKDTRPDRPQRPESAGK